MGITGFVLVIYTCIPFSYTLLGGHVCRRNKTQGNNTWLVHEYCCSGYEEKNNKCEQKNAVLVLLDRTVIHVPITTMEKDVCLNVIVITQHIIVIMSVAAYKNKSPSGTVTPRGSKLHQNHFHLIFGTACAIVVCIFFLAVLGYWLHIRNVRKKEECRNQHNEVYGSEEANGVADNQIGNGQSAEEPLYDSNEEACYSILKLRVNNSNESHKEPSSSKEPFFANDHPYGFVSDYPCKN